ncbi:MAG: GntR family transcriptional regulator [Acidobacteria bacterium]|nr:GntR family transcriptional regulator [Acidobacteriota bacterium]
MIKFNLDKEVALTFYDQIKGQLLSAIYCGKIKEGDRLPSIRELAEDLDVNYKTARKVYLRLAEENYIEIVKGSGAFLQKGRGEKSYERMRRQAIFKLLGEVAQKAQNLGLSSARFLRLLEGYCSGTNLRKIHLLVIDHEEEAFIFSRELKMRLGVDASSVSLNQIQTNGANNLFKNSDYFLTTSWHMEEVRRLAEKYKKQVMEIKPSPEIYTEILNAARDRKVAIVIQDEETMHASWEIFMNIYHPSTEKQFWIAPINREDLIVKIIQEAELIFVSPMCWDEMRKRTPAEIELKTYENFISQETIDSLKELQLLGVRP